MYGMVNRALQDMVTERIAADGWSRVCREARMEEPIFVSMKTYDDAVTYDLVGAASAVLGVEAGDLLVDLGRYWIRVTATESYGSMFMLHGRSLHEFLSNLDHMHARLALAFPEMRAPSFRLEDLEQDAMAVRYWSTREGLAPFVVGLLEGLCERFDEPFHVEHVSARGPAQDHDLFQLTPAR